ncbi:hypothetical protein PLICRDRAFT_103854 [Plicaturopsis crispa FD-325 SS-3]|nr:hypothetical protein PLICRDRAFT_103854 [Plicaturopsis crispa FD-325 SS-3]
MSASATSNPALDPYTAKAENTDVSPQDKINDLHKIVKEAKVGMLTTRSSDGSLHSRAMAPAGPVDNTQLSLIFIANNVSNKFEEIQNDVNVNVSFADNSTTNWASFAGKARVSRDPELIKKHWSHLTAAYFGDLKDGVHKGDALDPRVSIIEVIPDEIRYWLATSGAVGRALGTAVNAATGKTSVPGEIRTISKAEIQLTEGLHGKGK